jgi:hypothetical protein
MDSNLKPGKLVLLDAFNFESYSRPSEASKVQDWWGQARLFKNIFSLFTSIARELGRRRLAEVEDKPRSKQEEKKEENDRLKSVLVCFPQRMVMRWQCQGEKGIVLCRIYAA